jgi:hypothetical protein
VLAMTALQNSDASDYFSFAARNCPAEKGDETLRERVKGGQCRPYLIER